LVQIKGGFFIMGSDEGPDDEKPAHEVWVDNFLIGKYTIINHEYDTFVKASKYPVAPPFGKDSNFNDPMQPVVGVSWFDANAFCQWLAELTRNSYRLPTEAEWEYAARSGNARNLYPWGTRGWSDWPELHDRFKNGPEPIGSFEANAFGISDMGMNVHEWCSDWYDANYYYYSPGWNPKGAQDGTRRSSRGGSWRHQIKITRCAARSSLPPGMRYADYGFRVVLDVK
jgi:formylglycine-generating enzyme required for sulfatase activity